MALRQSFASACAMVVLGACSQYLGPTDIACRSNSDCPGGYACGPAQLCVTPGSFTPGAPSALTYSSNPASYTKGVLITDNRPTSRGGAVVYYTITPALPSGLSLNGATGVISGIPGVLSPETVYTVTATNPGGSATVSLTLTVNDVPPSNLTYATNPAVYTRANPIADDAPSTAGGGPVVSYTIEPGALPDGLRFSAATGIVSGTPTAVSPATDYTVTAANSGGATTATLSIAVNDLPPSGLTYAANPVTCEVGLTVNDAPSTSGGGGQVVSYEIVPDTLPAGLHLDAATGVVSGMPTAITPATTYTITAENSGGETSTTLTIAVDAALTVAPSTATIARGDGYSGFITSGGVGATTWSISPEGAGVIIDPATGAVASTSAATIQSYMVKATDALSDTASATLTVNGALSISPPAATISQGGSYSGFTTSGGVGAVTWGVSPIGQGVSVDSSTGVVSATASATIQSYTITALDSMDNMATAIVAVNDAFSITPGAATVAQGESYAGFMTNGGVGAVTWNVLPMGDGVTINSFTGAITTTASATIRSYSVTATDSLGDMAIAVLTMNAALAITPATMTIAQGDSYSGFAASGGVGSLSWSINPLGFGIVINSATGAVTTTSSATVLGYTVTATDSLGNAAHAVLTVNPALVIVPATAVITQGGAWSGFSASGGVGADTWNLSPMGVGVVLDTATGALTASASAALQSYTVEVTDTLSNTAIATLTVNPPLVMRAPAAATIAQGDIYSGFLTSGGTGAVTWSVSPTGSGVTINTSTGALAASTSATAQSYTVTATDTASNSATATLTVNAALAIAPGAATIAQGNGYSGFRASGGVGADTWTVSPRGAGVTIDASTGAITASASATVWTYTITATDTLSNTAIAPLTVNSALAVAPAAAAIAQGDGYTGFGASGGVGADTWTLSPEGAGVTIDAATGAITASLSATVRSYTVTATDTLSNAANATLVVNAALAIQAPTTVTIAQGDGYVFGTTGGAGPITWSVSPTGAGVTIGASSGAVSSTLSAAVGPYTVVATDSIGNAAPATLNLNAALSVAPAAAAVVRGNRYSLFVSSGGVGTPTWSVSPTGAGVTITPSTGAITTTASATLQSYSVKVTDALSNTATATLTVNDVPPAGLTYSTNPAVYPELETIPNNTPSTSGGGAVISYAVSPPLPAGLSLSPTTGTISGAPAVLSTSTQYTVTATNSGGFTTALLTLTVDDAPWGLSYASSPAVYTLGQAITVDTLSNGSGAAASYAVSPSLPAGLLFSTTTGDITGTPTALATTASYTVTATNSGGSATVTLSITVIGETATTCGAEVGTSGTPCPAGQICDLNGLCATTVYTVNANGTVTDDWTGLVWQQTVPGGYYAWSSSQTYCESLSLAGAAWELPSVQQLFSLVMIGPDPTIDQAAFPATPVSQSEPGFWSATADTASGEGWLVDFIDGASSATLDTSYGLPVRCVATLNSNDVPPRGLTYSTNPAVYPEGATIQSNTPTIEGGDPTSYVINPALPQGLTLSPTTGIVSGAPTVLSSAAQYSITATNSLGSTTATLTITVNGAPWGFTYTTGSAVYSAGQMIASNTPLIPGGPAVTSWAISPSLPAGLLFSTTTGDITGTPTEPSFPATYTVTATEPGGSTAVALGITVMGEISVACGPEAGGNGDACVAGEICDLNGLCAVTSYTVNGDGTVTDDWTGLVWQQTVASGTYEWSSSGAAGSAQAYCESLSLGADAWELPSVQQLFSLGLQGTSAPPIDHSAFPGTPGTGFWSATADNSVVSWYVSWANNYVEATYQGLAIADSVRCVATAPSSDVSPRGLTYSTNPAVYPEGQTIQNDTPSTVEGGAAASYTINPSLPQGLTLSTTTGIISGAPTALSAATPYTVTATNSGGSTTATLTITVNGAPWKFNYAANPAFDTSGQPITTNVPVISGGPAATSWAVTPALPAGLLFSATTGDISGTPTAASPTSSYTVTATDSGGSTTTSLSLTVLGQTSTGCNTSNNCPTGEICDLNALCAVTNYTVNGDGTVTDQWTGLVWQQAVPSSPCPLDGSGGCDWADAQTYCGGLTLSGGGWVLPSVQQLYSLVTKGTTPEINQTAFPGTGEDTFWSATANGSADAWAVYPYDGNVTSYPTNGVYQVRCVR